MDAVIDGFPPEIESVIEVIQSGWSASQRDAARRGERRLSSTVVPPRKGREKTGRSIGGNWQRTFGWDQGADAVDAR